MSPGHARCCAWCLQENFEANSDNGAFEAQYRKLLVEIQQIYESAKEFHGKVGSWAAVKSIPQALHVLYSLHAVMCYQLRNSSSGVQHQ
jgi:hypothetical protein